VASLSRAPIPQNGLAQIRVTGQSGFQGLRVIKYVNRLTRLSRAREKLHGLVWISLNSASFSIGAGQAVKPGRITGFSRQSIQLCRAIKILRHTQAPLKRFSPHHQLGRISLGLRRTTGDEA
jgi:hypothetical protein